MKQNRGIRWGSIAVAGILALGLGACSSSSDATDPANTPDSNSSETPNTPSDDITELSGNLAGSGASSQEKAMEGWIAGFADIAPDVVATYDPQGSGAGREQFLSGAVQFAGSDAALKEEEITAASQRCFGGEALELPLYISPIAVIYNLPDLAAENINMSAATLAKVFSGEITEWNDPEIAQQNEGVELPATSIIPVHRSDESGTTENFTEYLAAAAEGEWAHEPSGTWPIESGQSGSKTQGMIDTVSGAEGAIGYADASRAGDLGTIAIKVGEEYVPYSAEAAAAVVDASPRAENATSNRLVVELDRATTASGAYPLVLISYSIACSSYDSQSDVDNVKAFLTYMASSEGQARAADPSVAGAAPISDALHAEVQAAIDGISLAG